MPETFTPKTWADGQAGGTPIIATELNRIENGIETLDDRAAALELGVATPITVTYAASVTIDATQGSLFRITATGDLTIADITGGTSGQEIDVEILASGAIRLVTVGGSTDSVPSGTKWTAKFRYDAGRTEWLVKSSSGSSSSSSGDPNTVYSFNPPAGLNALATNGTNQATTLQAHLNYVAGLGGGQVRVSKPGSTITFTAGVSVPNKVQLISDEATLLDFGGMSSGTAITVSGHQDATPLVGVRIQGPNTTAAFNTTTTGISVTGIGLRFYNCRVKYFGKGIDVAHSNTYILAFIGGDIGNCGTGFFANASGLSLSQFGERITVSHYTIYNGHTGFNADSVALTFSDTSFDYNSRMGLINGAKVSIDAGSHIEGSGGNTYNHLFDVTGNPDVRISDTTIIMNGGSTPALQHIFNPSNGPANYSWGRAFFDQVSCYYVNQDGEGHTRFSDEIMPVPTGVTSMTFRSPFPLHWCWPVASFTASDFYTQLNTDVIRVSGLTKDTGLVTLAMPSNASARWVRIRF